MSDSAFITMRLAEGLGDGRSARRRSLGYTRVLAWLRGRARLAGGRPALSDR